MIRIIILSMLALLASPASHARTESAPASPSGEIAVIHNFASFAGLMNLARGAVRIVAIVSPTAPEAHRDLSRMLSAMSANSSKRLRAYVIMTPVTGSDSRINAVIFAGRHIDRRVVFMWDEKGAVADAYAASPELAVAGTATRAHSLCFLYDTAQAFTTAPPTPVLWMHNHATLRGPRLDEASLRERADELVERVETDAATIPSPKK